jgi:DNA-binding LacI/PurR family transcriptional regulator
VRKGIILTQQKPKTLADIAKLAGVSPGTVSRALSNTELVNEKTKSKILAIVEQFNYKPNLAARNLRTRKTGAIAVIVPLGHEKDQHLSDPFFTIMLGFLADELSERGFDLLLSRVIPKNDNWLLDFIDSGRADGIIVLGQSNQSKIINKEAKNYRPMVVWGANENDQIACTIGSDNRFGGMIAAIHLVERGCKSIAFLGDTSLPEIRQRLEGCQIGSKASGINDEVVILETHLTADASFATISQFIKQGKVTDGIVAASDVIAMSALRALEEANIRVPQDVKVIGYDDLEFAPYMRPPLTSVKQDLKTSAQKLVELLLKRINGEHTQSIILQPQLSRRQSTGE